MKGLQRAHIAAVFFPLSRALSLSCVFRSVETVSQELPHSFFPVGLHMDHVNLPNGNRISLERRAILKLLFPAELVFSFFASGSTVENGENDTSGGATGYNFCVFCSTRISVSRVLCGKIDEMLNHRSY